MYTSIKDLPESLTEYLPETLQEIYLKAYQKAWQEYEEFRGGEAGQAAVAHRDAMMAVRRLYTYHEGTGKWYPKGEAPQEEEEQQGILSGLKELVADL
jgi:cation transport regulator